LKQKTVPLKKVLKKGSKMKKNEQTSEKKGSWFSTHPPLTDRIEKCIAAMSKYPDAASLAVVRERFASYKKLF
jgi:Zn-dependent protease with chaperone function